MFILRIIIVLQYIYSVLSSYLNFYEVDGKKSIQMKAVGKTSYPTLSFDVNILQDLYDSTNGQHWQWRRSYKGNQWEFTGTTNRDPCIDNWQGISCKEDLVNKVSRVTQIDLSHYNLVGTLPSSLGNLSELNYLDLTNNDLYSTIPASIGNLSQLTYLSLSSNSLIGTIPLALNHLDNLQYFFLNGNFLNGTIPMFIGDMVSLQNLSLSYNFLTGTIPSSFQNLNRLKFLSLTSNRLHGILPSFLCHYSQLDLLQLTSNRFNGSLLECFSNLTKLTILYLDSNEFTGTIPGSYLVDLPILQILVLSKNQLTGSLPDVPYPLKDLQMIMCDSNQLNGTIPATFGNFPSLTDLYLEMNLLSGSIPTSLSNLTSLINLYLYSNQLTGSIPPELSSLTKLVLADLSLNHFYGTLPDIWDYFPDLSYLYIYSNQLSGPLPDSLGAAQKLSLLYLFDNQFNSTIPFTFQNLSYLSSLGLSSNSLSGSLPSFIGSMTNLTYIYLYANRFTGSIFDSFLASSKLSVLSAFSNKFSGTLPTSLRTLSMLTSLSLNSNLLHGPVGTFSSRLQELFLSFNFFSGILDDVFYGQSQLKSIQLQYNDFTGSLEGIFFFNTQPLFNKLQALDISNNHISGTIPSDLFRSAPGLQNISLTKNCMSGSIPESICDANLLFMIDMGGLHASESCQSKSRYDPMNVFQGYVSILLSGSLPDCVWDLPSLHTLQLAGNGLSGNLEYLNNKDWQSSSLENITLSYNRLTGAIPVFLQQNQYMKVLDLSYNKLTGHIDLMSTLMNLSEQDTVAINLQVNRLTGKIPPNFHDAWNIKVLQGNMFSCTDYASNAPINDPSHNSYSCGSQPFNDTLSAIGFASGLVLVVVGLYYSLVYCFEKLASSEIKRQVMQVYHSLLYIVLVRTQDWGILIHKDVKTWNGARKDDEPHLSNDLDTSGHSIACLSQAAHSTYIYFQRSMNLMRFVSVAVALYSFFLCMPIYITFNLVNDSQYSSYADQYTWLTTSVYLTGDLPASVLLVLWLTALVASISVVLRCYGYREPSSFTNHPSSDRPVSLERLGRHLSQRFNKSLSEMMSSTSPTFFQRYRKDGLVKALRLHTLKKYALNFLLFATNGSINLGVNILFVSFIDNPNTPASVKFTIQIFVSIFKIVWNVVFVKKLVNLFPQTTSTINVVIGMLVFNMVIAPLLASSMFNSQCFETLLFGSKTVTTNYHYVGCEIGVTNQCRGSIDIQYSDSFQPGFIYLYSCGAALLTAYIPVYVISSVTMIFITPLTTFLMAFLDRKYLPNLVYTKIPKLLRPQDKDKHTTMDSLGMYNILFILFINFIQLFTFGLVSPILCVLLVVAIAVNSFMWQFFLERFVYYEDPNSVFYGSDQSCTNADKKLKEEAVLETIELPSLPSGPSEEAINPLVAQEKEEERKRRGEGKEEEEKEEEEVHDPPSAPELDLEIEQPHAEQIITNRLMNLDLACQASWTFLYKSFYLLSSTSLIIYGLLLFDMTGNENGFQHASWVIITVGILLVLFIVILKIVMTQIKLRKEDLC